jgi:hypothetical protein
MSNNAKFLDNYITDTVYIHPFGENNSQGKYLTLVISEKIKLSIQVLYIDKKEDTVKFELIKLKNGTEEEKITLSSFSLEKIQEFLNLLQSLDLKNSSKEKIKFGNKIDIADIKQIFTNKNSKEIVKVILDSDIDKTTILNALEIKKRQEAIREFESLLIKDSILEARWQKWFKENDWVFNTDFVEILEKRTIDTSNITDFLVESYDGFIDIVEIKRHTFDFWNKSTDHNNYIPSSELTKAIMQCAKYIYELEREAGNSKFIEQNGIKPIKPRCTLIFGRSNNWSNPQKEEFRILNSMYHSISIMTYDNVLDRAKKLISYNQES